MAVYATVNGNYAKNSAMSNEYWSSCSANNGLADYDQGAVLQLTSEHQNSNMVPQYAIYTGHNSVNWLDDQYDSSK